MKKLISYSSSVVILFSAFCFFSVAVMAFVDPQQVMDLVNVRLSGPDSFSSIRGVYGGVGITLAIMLVYLRKHNSFSALFLLSMLWGFYALSRTITIFTEGPLSGFGRQWLLIELVLFIASFVLLLQTRYKAAPQKH